MRVPYFATQAQVTDVGGALQRGQSLADMTRKAEYQQQDRALADEMRNRMPELYGGAMAGDQASLAELARYSPETAMGIAKFAQNRDIQNRAADLSDRKFGFTQEQAGIQNQLAQDKFNFNRNQADRNYTLSQQTLGLQRERANRQQEMQDLQMQEMQNAINSQAYQQDKQIMNDTYRNLLNASPEQRPEIYEATKSGLVANGLKIPEEFDRPYDDSILDTMRGTLEAAQQAELLVAQRKDPFYKQRAKDIAAQFTQVQADGVKAQSVLPKLDTLEQALATYSQGGSNAKMSLANGLRYIGFTVDESATAGEMIEALGNQLALGNRGELGPGTMTNEDFEILKSYVPTLGKSVDANKAIINILRKTSQRNIELANQSRQIEQSGVDAITMSNQLQQVRSGLYAKDGREIEQQEQQQYNQRVQQFQNMLQSDQAIGDLETLYNGIAD